MRACGGLCTGAENGVKKMKIVLQNLTKTFPGRGRKDRNDVTAVDDLSCEIPDGELIALLGPSGCGKSTTLNLLCGLEKPTSGRILSGKTILPICRRSFGASVWYFRITLFIRI